MLSLFVPVSSLFASSVQLSFGGIPLPGKPGTFLRKNFHGCMENLYYNTINIIDLAKRRKPQIHSVVSLVLFLFYIYILYIFLYIIFIYLFIFSKLLNILFRDSALPAFMSHCTVCTVELFRSPWNGGKVAENLCAGPHWYQTSAAENDSSCFWRNCENYIIFGGSFLSGKFISF